jgi:hypothetical protein
MAYGIEVSNRFGRTQFSTEIDYGVLTASSQVNVFSRGNSVPTSGTGEFIIARPNDNESGVVAPVYEYDRYGTGNYTYRMFGSTQSDIDFGAADGFSYRKVKAVKDTQNPATSGYGLEVLDSTGNNLIFSSNITSLVTAEMVVQLEFNKLFKFKVPANENFNNYYVGLEELLMNNFDGVSSIYYTVQGGFGGSYCYFNNATKEITLLRASIDTTYLASEDYKWNDIGTGGSGGFFQTVSRAGLATVYKVKSV